MSNPEKLRKSTFISQNPNLTVDYVMSSADKNWKWDDICENEFTYDKDLYVNRQISKLCLMSLMDEDYFREANEINRNNAIDLLFQCEAIVGKMAGYV